MIINSVHTIPGWDFGSPGGKELIFASGQKKNVMPLILQIKVLTPLLYLSHTLIQQFPVKMQVKYMSV